MELPAYRWRLAHLAALWGYGVSQPVFSMLKGNPEFLVVRGSTRSDVIVFTVILVALPPLAAVGAEAAAGLVSRALGNAVHAVAVWGFSFLAAVQLTRLLDTGGRIGLLLPVALAAVVAIAYVRWSPLRSFLSLSLALPVVGALVFVFTVPLAVDDAKGANVAVARPVPIVLVVFDEFPVSSILRPDGSIDAVRYPSFGRLAREATWYPRTTSVQASTTQAVPAILTGQLPRNGELPTLADHPHNLFTLLGERYRISAFEQATRLCPSRYCPRTRHAVPLADRQLGLFYDVSVGFLYRVLPRAYRAQLPPIGEKWGGFGDDSRVDVRERVLGALDRHAWEAALNGAWGGKREQFARFLASLRGPGRALSFEHALLPHSPSAYLPSGKEYGSVTTVDGIEDDWGRWRPSAFLVDQALQRHLLQVGFTDRMLGELLRRLRSVGLYDRALVVVTADHGASFRPGGFFREPSSANLADIAGVPLFVKYPGEQRGSVDRRDAKTIDILPTIADVVGTRIPWPVDGRSLRSSPVVRPVTVGTSKAGIVTGNPDAVAAGVMATARRNAGLFGVGAASLYRLGPHRELLGRRVEARAQEVAAGSSVRLDDTGQLEDVRVDSAFVPSYLLGKIGGGAAPRGTALAIAVNGRVAGMTRSFDRRGESRFAVVVPETSFRNGPNSVDVYAVAGSGKRLRLRWLGGTGGYEARTTTAMPSSRYATRAPGSAASASRWARSSTTTTR